MQTKRLEEVRDGPEAAILEMEKCANDLKSVVNISEDELCLRIHDFVACRTQF
jgi:hypothetical protein